MNVHTRYDGRFMFVLNATTPVAIGVRPFGGAMAAPLGYWIV